MPDGTTKAYPLPPVKNTGTVLNVRNTGENDSLEVTISISSDLLSATAAATAISPYYLIAQSRGIICYGASILFNGKQINTRKIDKGLFPTGIARFTLLNAENTPLNERIIFIDQNDNLEIAVIPDKEFYQTRDSIALNILVVDKNGKPVQGSLSVAMTDDSQVKIDSLSSNILTSLLLTSDLKGNIEEPAYYFQTNNTLYQLALDNLMLTQGWVGYDWKDVFNPTGLRPVYAAETGFAVKGKVSDVFNKSLKGTTVRLLSTRPLIFMDTVTAADGRFAFTNFPAADTLQFKVQAMNKKEKSFNVGVEVEEFKPPIFNSQTDRMIPWYINSDTTLLRQINTQTTQNEKIVLPNGGNLLNEVEITAKKIVKNSKNLNGPGEADQILDEKDMVQAKKMTLLDLLRQKIKGFNEGTFPAANTPESGVKNRTFDFTKGRNPTNGQTMENAIFDTQLPFVKKYSYKIFEKEMHLIIDGTDMEQFYMPYVIPPNVLTGNYILDRNLASERDRYEFIKQYLEFINAEDIKGIEVMFSQKYNMRYSSSFSSSFIRSLDPANADFVYVEVTTYSGNGAFLKKTPGVELFRPMPFVSSATFYKPKYNTTKNTPSIADLRSTIHWEPNVVTNTNGRVTVSFYSADRPGTYTVIIEGSDMNGKIGYRRENILIKPR